jgi:hypothetical protein
MAYNGVPRGDAQDARASPLPPPLCIPPTGHVHPPPPQPERLVIRKDEAVGTRKKCKFVYLRLDNFLTRIIIYKKQSFNF